MIAKCRISFDIPDSNGSVIRSGGAIGEQAINNSHTQVVRLPGSPKIRNGIVTRSGDDVVWQRTVHSRYP